MVQITDSELIECLKESSEHLTTLYKRHKDYCKNLMKKYHRDDELNMDIFHDAIILLYEKIKDPAFNLTCSIQTYLNSICLNQIKVRFTKNFKMVNYSEDGDERIDDWFIDNYKEKEDVNKIKSIDIVLQKFKENGGPCYDLIRLFYYEKMSFEKIAAELNYTNADNAKHQKSRCQKKLKEEAYFIYKGNA